MNSKLKPITDFDSLTDDQRDQLHHWLDEGIAVRTVMTKLKDEFGFVITYNKLYRYAQLLLQARTLSEQRENQLTVATFLNLLNGNPIPYDEAGLALIQKRAFEAACAPKLRVSQLATLQRVFHYKTARAECARRAAQTDRRNDLSERSLQLRHEIHTFRKQHVALNRNLFPDDASCGENQNNWWGDHDSRSEHSLEGNKFVAGLGSQHAAEPTSISRDAISPTTGVSARPDASLSQQGTTIREANVSNGETNSWRAREATGLGEGLSHTPTISTSKAEHTSDEPPSLPSRPSVKSFLSPEVIANNRLYDQKIDCGEIRVIYAPGKHYEIEYCNPADKPALERMHKSPPLRFFEDPTRTTFLPPLRSFGKNPYIPPQSGAPNSASREDTK